MMNPNNQFNQYNQPYQNYFNASPMYRQRRRSSGCCLIGCAPLILLIVILLAVIFYFNNHTLPHIPPFVTTILIVCAVPVALVVFVLVFIRSRIEGKGFKSSVTASLITLVLFGGVIALSIYLTQLSFPEVDMTRIAFTKTSVDASTGAHVHFVNPSNGVEQILCVGTNGHCESASYNPSELLGPGLRIEPGQMVTVVFPDTGDFPITSKIVPSLNMIIHVQDTNGDD